MSSFNFDGEKSVPASSCKLVRLHALVTVGVMRLILTCNLCTKVFDQQRHDGNLFLFVRVAFWACGGLPNSGVSISNCESGRELCTGNNVQITK